MFAFAKTMPRTTRAIALIAAASLSGTDLSQASVEEAHSFAMEAAAPHVADGFLLRGEPWSGKLAPGKRKVVRHQLFRGNEYWFWLGSPAANTGLTVKVYDRKGRPVHIELLKGERWAAARVLPPKTGSYLVVVTVAESDGDKVDWSMSYGYR
jgi:hypothetical protein